MTAPAIRLSRRTWVWNSADNPGAGWVFRPQAGRSRLRQQDDVRFRQAAALLRDPSRAAHLPGIVAMAALADEDAELRQLYIDEICDHIRRFTPGPAAPPAGGDPVMRAAVQAIASRLRPGAAVPWRGHRFDLSGVRLHDVDLRGVRLTGEISFRNARFTGTTSLFGAELCGGSVDFGAATFDGGTVDLAGLRVSGGRLDFSGAILRSGMVDLSYAVLQGGDLHFAGAWLAGGQLDCSGARFAGSSVSFVSTRFDGVDIRFGGAMHLRGDVSFRGAVFDGGLRPDWLNAGTRRLGP